MGLTLLASSPASAVTKSSEIGTDSCEDSSGGLSWELGVTPNTDRALVKV